MPEMSEKRHDPVGGNGNCSAQKLEHLREKSEQELLDELTQTMKWSDQEVDLDAIDAYLKVLEEKDPMPEQKKPEEALAAFKVWGDRIFEKCGIRRDEEGDGGKTLEIRGKRRLSARDGGANYQQS